MVSTQSKQPNCLTYDSPISRYPSIYTNKKKNHIPTLPPASVLCMGFAMSYSQYGSIIKYLYHSTIAPMALSPSTTQYCFAGRCIQ